jgi:DNA-binding transcriptional ArsR family regulator
MKSGLRRVGTLAQRTGLPADTLGHHLGLLKHMGLVFSQRKGKEVWYELNPERVRYEREENGQFTLTLTGRTGGAVVTIGSITG